MLVEERRVVKESDGLNIANQPHCLYGCPPQFRFVIIEGLDYLLGQPVRAQCSYGPRRNLSDIGDFVEQDQVRKVLRGSLDSDDLQGLHGGEPRVSVLTVEGLKYRLWQPVRAQQTDGLCRSSSDAGVFVKHGQVRKVLRGRLVADVR